MMENKKKAPQKQKIKKSEEKLEKTSLTEGEDADWRTTIDWERIYKYICIGILALFPFFVYDMFMFRAWCDRVGFTYLPWNFLLWSLFYCCVLAVYRNVIAVKLFTGLVLKSINQKYQGSDREVRAKKVVKWGTDILYYSAATFYAWFLFGNYSWFPLNLNKDWDNQGFFENWPNKLDNEYTHLVDLYLCVQLGQHIYALLELIIVRRKLENKYYEWLNHHILACTLIFYSIYNNYFTASVAILVIHDVGDIFLAWFKLYGMFRTDLVFYINTVNMIISWFITRIYIFLKGLIIPLIHDKIRLFENAVDPTAEHLKYTERCYIYMLTLCFILQFMHFYWFCTMFTMLFKHIGQIVGSNKKVNFQNDYDFHKKPQDAKSKSE